MTSERSPRRRRTDSDTSADAIAQANSTLQVFLGQQQNRWMTGYVPSGTKKAGNTAANSAPPEGNPPALQPNAEAATQRPQAQSRAREMSVIESESPAVLNGGPAIPTSTSTRVLNSMAPPGLPSPAASDENGTSPTSSQISGTPMGSVLQPCATPKRGRPSLDHGHPPAVQSGSPSRKSRQRQQSRTPSTSVTHPNQFVNAQMPGQMPPHAHGRQSPIVPSQPVVPAPQSAHQAQDSMLSQMVMFQRYQHFRHNELSTHRLNNVDSGRLYLVKDAIDKGDLFYIVLSQIHVLAKGELMPQTAKQLVQTSFKYLDLLICSIDLLSPNVREWLSNFPAPILQIYSSTQSAAIFEPVVQDVSSFLRLLPQHWDPLTRESKARDSPPLVEDLYDILHLPSPVFQTTAFRAIARLLLDQSQFKYPEKGIDKLESLHKMDQMWFSKHGRRNPEEKALAYRAFRITKEAWKFHEPRIRDNEQRQPPDQRKRQHSDFMYPPDAFAAFQFRQKPTSAVSSTIPQQQEAATATRRSRAHNHHRRLHPSITSIVQQQAAGIHSQGITVMPQQSIPASVYIFPRDGEMPRAQATNPDPIRSALHQAHLRSPILEPVEANLHAPRLYRHVKGFALSPTKIKNERVIDTITFDIPQQNFEKIPATVPSEHVGERPIRHLTEDSHTYRLRCSACPPTTGFPTESTWVVADNYWPDNLYLEFNDSILEPRRKLHHGRYLPIDLTHLLKPGQNTVTAIVNRASTDQRPFDYCLAVEIVGVSSHESIRRELQAINAMNTLETIKTSLTSDRDDVDLAVVSSNLTIKLFDPYSNSKISDTPVRGVTCRHKDCFDFETFLSVCKREKPGWPTIVDCWRCPICRGDVRPDQLVIDGFLVEVRRELEKRDLLDTRAIVVEADGSWRPKEEERTGMRSPSLEREERSISEKNVTASASKKVVEVIEID